MKEKELKPCPFCGGEANIGSVKFSETSDQAKLNGRTVGYYGQCVQCCCNLSFDIGRATKEQAITEWNTRINPLDIPSKHSDIDALYTENFPEYGLSEKFKKGTIKTFLKSLPVDEVVDCMHMACSKVNDDDRSIKYFCGICWNKIKGARVNG